MCERILQGWTRELGAIRWMCWNPNRQAYVALFPLLAPLLSSSLSICLHPLSQASCLSLHLFFVLFPGYHVGTVWDVFVCLLRQYLSQTEKWTGERHSQSSMHTHTHKQINKCMFLCAQTHIWAHTCTDESVLLLKTPRDSEKKIDMKISDLEQNRNRVVKEKTAAFHIMCTHTSQLSVVSTHVSWYTGKITHLTWANAKYFHVVAMCTANRRTLCDAYSICIKTGSVNMFNIFIFFFGENSSLLWDTEPSIYTISTEH